MNVLAADVGGTHFNMGVVDTKTKKIVFEQHTSTKDVDSVIEHVQLFIETARKNDLVITQACFAVAGPVQVVTGRRCIRMTYAPLIFDESQLEKNTSLEKVLVINDFEAIGHAISTLKSSEIVVLRPGKKDKGPKLAIGPGTGLGKVLLVPDIHTNKYLPVTSEVDHTDFPVHSQQELHLIEFIQRNENLKGPVTYGHILSGKGLERLYEYYAHEPLPARLIVLKKNAHARDAVNTFVKFYARCFRNEILDAMATGGIYLAGGIAAANPSIFGTQFLTELNNHHEKKFRTLLENIPVTIITNYNISLRGAAQALEVSV